MADRGGEESSRPAPETGSGGPAEAPPERADDGLDLARSVTRATTGARTGAAARRRRRTPTDRRVEPVGPTDPRTTGMSGARPDDRDPQPLDRTVDRVVADRGWELDLRVHGVFARWADLVGPEIGAHTQPESFVDGTLVVRSDSTAWATQLRLLAPTVVRRLNEELGEGTVKVVEVAGPRVPSWTKGRRSTRDGRGPRDTYG